MLRFCPLPFAVAVATLALLLAPAAVHAQSFEQTLPPGYMNADGLSATSFPFNSADDSTWLWYYASPLFNASGPILINEIYVRAADSTSVVDSFLYTDFEVTLFESSNQHNAIDTNFDKNIETGHVVRRGSFAKGDLDATTANGVTGGWIPFRLEKSFLYDPTSGNPLGIQMRTCGVVTAMNISIDAPNSSVPLTRRQGNSFDCAANTGNFAPQTFTPIVKIDYTPVMEQTLPAGFLNTEGNSSSGLPFNTVNDSTWHWHYDSSEFVANGPITISEIAVRANNGAFASAFDFTGLEVTLIEASTDYQVGSHDLTFANNILRSKTVRAGAFSGPGTKSSGSTGSWISLQLTGTFDYNPASGNDLIIELRVCGPNAQFGTTLDGVIGVPGSVGGNRYGDASDCAATVATFNNNEFVPLVKVSYTERIISVFPYREDFDHFGGRHATSDNLPPGWLNNSQNSPDNWRFHHKATSQGTAPSDHSTGKTGLGFYATADDSLSSQTERLESPFFDISTLSNPILTFWLFSNSVLPQTMLDENAFDLTYRTSSNAGTISSDPQSPAFLLTDFDTVFLQQSGCWTKYGVDLSNLNPIIFSPGDLISFGFRVSTDSSQGFFHDFAVDDVFIGEAAASEGGQAASVNGRLDVNDSWNNNGLHANTGADGPYYACARPGENIYINLDTPYPYQPTALWLGPLNIGVATFGALGQMDTGTTDTTGDGIPESIFLIGSGLNPNPSFFDLFFFTNGAGDLELVLPTNPSFPPGVIGTFQGATADGSGSIFLSNAVELTFEP